MENTLCKFTNRPNYHPFFFFFFTLPHILECGVAHEVSRGVCSDGSAPASRGAALWTSGMCKDDSGPGCGHLLPLCLPLRQRCWSLLTLRRGLGEGFSAGAVFTPGKNCLRLHPLIRFIQWRVKPPPRPHSCFTRPEPAHRASCSSTRSTR